MLAPLFICRKQSVLVFLISLWIQGVRAADFPPPADLGPTNTYGFGLQRTMRLLESSTAQNPNTVRILFYGQSITADAWYWDLYYYLHARFPSAKLLITNLAIGGFTVDLLVKTAEADLYPFYPDLLIFQVYGSTMDYEKLIARTRSRTTADILIQTDHPLTEADLSETTDPAVLTPADGDAWRNYVFLPDLARRYGAELADIRTCWKKYLQANDYAPAQLLRDSVHLNAHGNYLMGELIKAHLRADPSFSSSEWSTAVTEYRVGRDIDWTNGVLALRFEGNRVDLLTSGANGPAADFFLNGSKPGSYPELYSFERSSYYPGSYAPFLVDLSSRSPLLEEDWTVTIDQVLQDGFLVEFSLQGSKTGRDGAGFSDRLFVSNSGRVVIEPGDWLLTWGRWFVSTVTPGTEIKWSVGARCRDTVAEWPATPSLLPIAEGLANGIYTLTARGSTNCPITAFRVYNPRQRPQPVSTNHLRLAIRNSAAGKASLTTSGGERYILESDGLDGAGWRRITSPLYELEWERTTKERAELFRAVKME